MISPSIEDIRKNIFEFSNLDLSTHGLEISNQNEVTVYKLPISGKRKRTGKIYEEVINKVQQMLKDQPKIMNNVDTVNDLLTICHHISQNSKKINKKIEEFKIFILTMQLIRNDQLNHLPVKEALDHLQKSLKDEAKQEIQYEQNFDFLSRLNASIKANTIYPEELLSILQNHIKEDSNLSHLSLELSKKINKMAVNPNKYRGKRAALATLPNCRLEMALDGKSVKLLIIPDQNSKIAEGSFKVVREVHRFDITLELIENVRNYSYYERVLISPNGNPLLKMEDVEKHLRWDYHIQLELSKLKSDHLAELPQVLLPMASQKPEKNPPFELEQHRYPLAFDIATQWWEFPGNSSDINDRKITFEDELLILCQIAATCRLMHRHDFVHCDIKPGNILLQWEQYISNEQDSEEEEGIEQLDSFLTDFNMCREIGYHDTEIRENYPFWDTCKNNGWVTPFCDIYGLTICLGEMLIPKFFESLSKNRQELIEQNKFETAVDIATKKFIERCLDSQEIERIFGAADGFNPLMCQNKIKTFLEKNVDYSYREKLLILHELLAILEAALDLIFKVILTDREIYQFLEKKPKLQKKLQSKDQKVSVISKFETKFPLYNSQVFLEKLESILRLYRENFTLTK